MGRYAQSRKRGGVKPPSLSAPVLDQDYFVQPLYQTQNIEWSMADEENPPGTGRVGVYTNVGNQPGSLIGVATPGNSVLVEFPDVPPTQFEYFVVWVDAGDNPVGPFSEPRVADVPEEP